MSYLDRLKDILSEKRHPTELPKLPKVPFGSFGSSLGERLTEISGGTETEWHDQPVFRGAVEIVSSESESIWVATDDAAVSLVPPGGACFTSAEIFQLAKLGEGAAWAALMVKKVFGNDARVIEG